MKKKRVTLKDISDRVRVSTTAVSLTLNDDRSVILSETTRQIIKKTAIEMGYDFSRLERRRKENRNVLYVTDNWNMNHISTSFFSNVAVQLKRMLFQEGYRLIESEFNGEDSERLKFLVESYPRIIVTSSFRFINALNRFNSQIPIIFLQGELNLLPENQQATILMVDDKRVGELAAGELLNRNACNCALVFPSDSIRSVRQRLEGFTSVWSKTKRNMEPLYIPDFETVDFDKLDSILQYRIGDFDSYYFYSDALALYGLRIFHNAGLSVPEDILVIGTDNLYWGEYTIPSLTTMDLKESQFAGFILKEVLLGEKVTLQSKSAVIYSIQPKLIVRESTSGPNSVLSI